MTDWQGTNPDELPTAYFASDKTKLFLKKAMRRELRRKIGETNEDSTRVVREVADYLSKRPQIRVVALFAPLPGEVNLMALSKGTERVWVFPQVNEDSLVFYQVKDAQNELKPGAYGILEPLHRLPIVNVSEIDLFLCPGLGFDTCGGRIGRGKGFYDGILAQARPDSVKLGACFSHQIVDEVVMEQHDIRMDGIIVG